MTVNELTSDHYAVIDEIKLPTYTNGILLMGKRLTILQKHWKETKNSLQEMFDNFCSRGIVSDVDIFEGDIATNTERSQMMSNTKEKLCKKKQSNTMNHDWWYNKNEIVKRLNKAYKVKASYLAYPSWDNYTTLQRMAEQAQHIKYAAKKKDWHNFI